MHLAVIGAVVDDLSVRVLFIENARELQHPVERRIEGADLFGVGIGDADARKLLLPRRLRLRLGRVEAVVADFRAQVAERLFGADEGGGDADVDLVALLRLEAEHRADMVGFAGEFVRRGIFARPGACKREVAVEFGDEIIVEIVGHAAVIVADIAGDAAVLDVDLDHRAACEPVEQDMRIVAFGEGEAELRRTFGRGDLCGHVIVGEVDLVRIGARDLGLVAEPAAAFLLLDLHRAGFRHQREGGIVVHPRARLVRLLDAADLFAVIGIAPAAAGLAGHGGPAVHTEGHRDRGIGVAVGQAIARIGAHQRVDVIDERGLVRGRLRECCWRSDAGEEQRARSGTQHHLADRLHFVSPLFAVRAGSGRAATPSFVIFTGAIVPSALKIMRSIASWRRSPESSSSGRR